MQLVPAIMLLPVFVGQKLEAASMCKSEESHLDSQRSAEDLPATLKAFMRNVWL